VTDNISDHARELSRRGASKGGRARAANMSKEQLSAANRQAALARWNKADEKEIRWAVAQGALEFGDRIIPCAVLDNGVRVLTQQGVLLALGRARTAKGGEGASTGGLPAILRPRNLGPFIDEPLIAMSQSIIYRPLVAGYSKGIAYGLPAETLPMICRVYIDAEDAGALTASQRHVAQAARRLLVALENVAMVALVDEATGFQALRPHNELQRILEAYVLPEHRPWVKTVPVEFTKELYRLWGWDLSETMQGPRYAGKLIRKYIYQQLPRGVLTALDECNPHDSSWHRRRKHHQFLTEEMGLEHFKAQLSGVMALMRASANKNEFERLFQKAYGIAQFQGEFQFELDEPNEPNK
jgi:hypothetical protein